MVPSVVSPYVSLVDTISSAQIGLGYKLTQAEVTQDNNYYTFATYPTAPNAARAYAGGGKSDWYLPSPSELNQLCKYAANQPWTSDATLCTGSNNPALGLIGTVYWTALPGKTGADPNIYKVWNQNLSNGSLNQTNKDGNGGLADTRPIRAFNVPAVSTTTNISASNLTPVFGQTITLTATTAIGAIGSMTFYNDTSAICSNITVSNGSSACSFTPAASTNYSKISATYSGGPGFYGSTSGNITISVSKASLLVIPDPKTLPYGSAVPTYTFTYQGLVNGDTTLSPSFTTGLTPPDCTNSTYSTSTSVSISPLFISCSGGSATNYILDTSATSNLTITKATPTISVALNAATPIYGSVDTITATSSIPGSVAFKQAGVTITGCESVLSTSVSPYVAQCGWVPDSASSPYSLSATLTPTDSVDYVSVTSTALTPTSSRASITITPTSGQSKVYGTQDPTLTYSITNGALVGSDQLSGSLTYASAGQNTAVGNYVISLGTLTSSNNSKYTITLNPTSVNFTITQAPQAAVSLSSLSAPYNPSNKSVTLTGSGGSGTGAYSYALNSGNTTVGCSVSGSVLTYVTAGTCIVDVTKAASTNYLAQSNTVSFSIGLASQSINFAALSARNYASDTFTASATSTSGLTVVFSSGSPSLCTTSGNNGSVITLLSVGTCVINADQQGDSNTSPAPTVSQNFLINPRLVTVTADAKTKLYGAADPALTYTVTSGSVLTGDSLTGILTRASGNDAGQYAITAGTLTSANNPKYAITFVSANLTISQISPTLTLTYPNNNVLILTPGVTDTPTVKSSTSNGTLTFAAPTTTSVCSVDPATGILSFTSAGTCQVVMTSAATTNYLQGVDTETVTSVLQSTSLSGIPSGNLVPMGGTFYASPVLTQTITGTSGSNGASVSIPANALPSTTAISVNLLTDASKQLALISGASSSVLSVVVSWVSPDGSVPQTSAGNPISVTLTNPAIKSGAKVYSVFGGVSTLVGTATSDGSVTSQITSDPVLVVVNPVAVATPSNSGGGGGYVAPSAPAPTTPADNSASKALADKQAADKQAADLKAAQDAADAAALKAAKEKMVADAKALADAKAAQDAATLKAAQDAADASAKAAAALQAAKDAAEAAAKAALNTKPLVTLFSISPKLSLSAYETAYLQRYVRSLKNGASVTCVGYIYTQGTTVAKATALAKSQASAVCSLMKKSNKTLKTVTELLDSKKAPKAAVGARWVAVSYRIDSFRSK